MSYEIAIDGAVSAELTHLLHAVQRQLNGHGMGIMGLLDAEAQTASAASSVKPCLYKDCPGTIIGHGPYIVVGLVVGLGIGYWFGRRSMSADAKR